MVVKRRTTKRKSLIEKILAEEYSGGPVLLEELRWKVLIQQYGPSFVEMKEAKQKSFARTIREHLAGHTVQKVPINSDTPVGLVARTAVYRLKNRDVLRDFLAGGDPCILCRYQTNMDVDEPRYSSRYVTPQYHVATFRFFTRRPEGLSYSEIERFPGTLMPATHKLSLVVPQGVGADIGSVAAVPWKLFAYAEKLDEWREIDATEPLSTVERNRW